MKSSPFSLVKTHRLRRGRRSGSVITLVATSMIVLLSATAISVDYGMLVMDANRLQRGCDAAALAGAVKLKKTGVDLTDRYNAIVEAQQVAYRNNVTVNASDVTFDDNSTSIRVASNTTRAFFFGRAVGMKSSVIKRAAKAGVAPVSTLTTQGPIHVAPIGITWETYNLYKDDRQFTHPIELVRQNKIIFGLNDLVLFDLRDTNAKSTAAMQSQLEGSSNEDAQIGDLETTLNAAGPAETKKLMDGIDTLLDRSAQAPWYDNNSSASTGKEYEQIVAGTIPRTNPRVVYLIITPSTTNPKNGTFDTEIQGFVPVYIDGYTDNSGSGGGNEAATGLKVNFRFLPPTVASDIDQPTDPNANYAGIRAVTMQE